MTKLKCTNKRAHGPQGYVWDYKGKSKLYTSCPSCRYNVNIKKHKVGK